MVAQKRRYLLFEVLYGAKPSRAAPVDELASEIKEAFVSHWGVLAEGQGNLRLLYWSPAIHLGVVRCATHLASQLRASLTMMTLLGGVPVQVSVHLLTGEVQNALRCGRELLHRWQRAALERAGPAEQAAVRQGFETELRLLSEVKSSHVAAFGRVTLVPDREILQLPARAYLVCSDAVRASRSPCVGDMKPRTPGSSERLERRLEAEKKKKALAKAANGSSEPFPAAAPPAPVALRRRASLALRQVIVSGTETALKVRTGGLVQDFLRRDEEAGRLLGDDSNRCLIDSSGSEDDAGKDASTSSGKDRRQGIFADRSFWRRARQIACFEYTCERLRNNVNTFWKERLADAIDGRERARAQAKEIYLVVCRLRGLEEAVNRQCELLAFRHALRDRREAEAALTTKLHRQFRAGDNGPHAFWSIYHKEDSKWMLPAPSSITGKQEQKEPYKPAYNRQLPDAKLVANPGAIQESEPSSHGHASLNSKRSQAARKVIQHRRDIHQKRLPAVTEVSSKPRRPSLPEVDHFDLESRPGTRQERGYFDLGRFLEPTRRAKRPKGLRPESRSVPALPQLGSRERGRHGGSKGGMGETMGSTTSSGSSWWNPNADAKPRRSVMAPVLEESAMSVSRSLPDLARPALRMPPFSLEAVAEPFMQPWQSEVRTQTGTREPEAEEDSATMHYIRVCNATGVVPTAAVLDMVRSHAISSGSEFLLDDELLAMSTMIRYLDRIKEVGLAGSTQLSDAVLNTFLQKLFGRPAMDSLEKLDLARCRGAGPRAMATIVGLLGESSGLFKLRHLDVSGIKISSNTLTSLCSAVHLHPAIRCLRLQDTGLGHHPAAASCLQDVLNAPALEVLGLGWNSFSEEALRSLGDMLASHKRLRELHLPNCDCRARVVSQPSMHIFLEGLGRNSSLTMLDLSMNRLTSISALVLEDSLAKHTKLQELFVGQNPFGVHGLRCLFRLLGQPTCGLKMLDAVGCQGTSDESRFAEGHCGYRASEPSGHYKLDLTLCHGRRTQIVG
ncbi:argH2 [Symbiodinium necroappetens]|uniref:ArgH2 protein n=1 Tax=Symbiodinium necroappetens TaxID=1628268 RepID=A0A812KS85_9DINO|nr:argH2 [Symbiodinium necroappetens]